MEGIMSGWKLWPTTYPPSEQKNNKNHFWQIFKFLPPLQKNSGTATADNGGGVLTTKDLDGDMPQTWVANQPPRI